jgi:rSAM/selenodomain-associated transferase 2
MSGTTSSFLGILGEPVLRETRERLAASWESLPERFRTKQQMFGRQGNCCGATLGVQPRCDFACTGCYLGEEANRVPPLPVPAIKAQMRALRPLLGNNGNLQLTDGEVTLRDEDELVELLRYADEVGHLPMLMTHGDSFRRRPGLLERLMERGGLREVGIHVDTTMRGRAGAAYSSAAREEELNPLREEFAQIIRDARRKTGLPLVAATTLTIDRDNLEGVPAAVRCVVKNADAFKMISFQPMAQVGRTASGLGGGVEVEELWRQIAKGLDGPASDVACLLRGQMWLGHAECNRYVHGFALFEGGRAPTFHPLWLEGEVRDERAILGYLERYGGASFRRDTRAQAFARLLAMVGRAPRFWLGTVLPFLCDQAKRMAPGGPFGLGARLASGRARLHHFNIVSHHFMSRDELLTPRGRERLGLCVFRLAVGDRLVSMCEVNALGVRDRFYEQLRAGGKWVGAGVAVAGSKKRLSVVIPALDEETFVAQAVASARAGGPDVEVIVVDGGSSDRTREIAASAGASVMEAPRSRGIQLDVGARRASGEWLVFLHADTCLEPGWANALASLPEEVIGGAFRFAVDSPRRGYRPIEAGVALRCRLFRMPYGDQAIFCRRSSYEAAGGFPHLPLMEDVAFVRRLARAGRLGFPPVRAFTSCRRWERHGLMRTTLMNLGFLGLYALGVPPQRLARLYYGSS